MMNTNQMGASTGLVVIDPTGAAFWKAAARIQIEAFALMTRRAKAYLEFSDTLARCKSPNDVITEQVRFWQLAQRAYLQGFDSVVGAATPRAVNSEKPQQSKLPEPRSKIVESTVNKPQRNGYHQLKNRDRIIHIRKSA